MMMKKYYRNRHATFMKALLDKKKNEQQLQEELKAKEERKKKKVRDKVLASLNEVVQPEATAPEQIPFKRGNSTFIGRSVRSSSMSVQNPIKLPKNSESTADVSQIPSSKEEKKRKMQEVYGFNDELPLSRPKKLNRQSSRGSVRSSHSVQTPIASRKERFAAGRHQPQQVMPSLKK